MFRGQRAFHGPPCCMQPRRSSMTVRARRDVTGILLASPAASTIKCTTPLFLVAHFHNVADARRAALRACSSAYHFWFPKAFGFRLDERWGRVSASYCWIAGLHGLRSFRSMRWVSWCLRHGAASPTQDPRYVPAFRPWVALAAAGALVIFAALRGACDLAIAGVVFEIGIANRVFAGDPWAGRSLEWASSAPPPEYNFAVICRVVDRPRCVLPSTKQSGRAYLPPDAALCRHRAAEEQRAGPR